MAHNPHRHNSLFYEFALASLALVSVSIGVYDFLVPRTGPGFTWLDWLDLSIVAVFILDFAVEARRRGSLAKYAKENWWEIPSLLPITGAMIVSLQGFSVVRALRLVRFVRFLRLLRAVGVVARLRETTDFVVRVGQRAGLVKLLGFAAVAVTFGALAGHLAELRTESRLARFDDAVWWSLNIFTNVAYVDFQPATGAGRVIAGVLEIMGIAFIGIFAGSIANALVREEPPLPQPKKPVRPARRPARKSRGGR